MKEEKDFTIDEMETLQRMYRRLRPGDSLKTVQKKLGLSEKDALFVVDFMEEIGNPISFVERNGDLVIRKYSSRYANQVKPDLEKLEKVRVCVISDTHFCNKKQQLHLVNRVYEKCHHEGIKTVLHCGDITDGDYTSVRKDTVFDLFKRGFNEQLDYVLEFYPKVKDINTYFILGNHDETHEKNGGAVLGPLLNRNRDDMIYLGQDEATINLGQKENLKIKMQHPGGGTSDSLSYKPQKAIENMPTGDKPKIFLQGHYHKSNYLFYRNVHSFVVPCLTDRTDFMAKNNLGNTVGAYYLDIYINKAGDVEFLSFVEDRFTAKDFIEDDYKKTKQLVIK